MSSFNRVNLRDYLSEYNNFCCFEYVLSKSCSFLRVLASFKKFFNLLIDPYNSKKTKIFQIYIIYLIINLFFGNKRWILFFEGQNVRKTIPNTRNEFTVKFYLTKACKPLRERWSLNLTSELIRSKVESPFNPLPSVGL